MRNLWADCQPVTPKLLLAAAFLVIAVLVLAVSAAWQDARAYQNFEPCARTGLGSTAPNTSSSVSTNFGVGLDTSTCAPFSGVEERPGQYNFRDLIFFTPPEWGVATDADVPNGTAVGTLETKVVLGLFDNGCQTILNVPFTIYDGTISQTGATVSLRPFGQPDRMFPMRDVNGDGVLDAATSWPTYLANVAAEFGMSLDQLVARYVGVNTTSVTGSTIVVNYLLFEPGATVSNRFNVDAALGYPALIVVQDPTAPTSDQDPVSDWCAPVWTNTTFSGTAGGATFRQNPGNGVYNFVTFVSPQPDADDDGIENVLDPCPLTANSSGWNPRGFISQIPGDQDADGLPDDCDPQPTTPSPCIAGTGISNSDEDCD